MKHLFLFAILLCSYAGFSQASVTVYNNTCSDKEVHVHWEDAAGSCGTVYSCSTYYMDAKVVPAGSNSTFTVPCGSATVYLVRAYTASGSSSSDLYTTGCSGNSIGNEKCDQFWVQGSGSHFEVNPF